jgi:hypothetical protein
MAAARGGVGCLVLVSGEAGIGKSRFCREVAARARARGFATAWGSCWPEGGAPPLWPWRAILDSLTGGMAARLLVDDPGGTTLDPERFTRFTAVVDRLAAECAKRPALVVVDDVQAADAGALLLARFIGRQVAGLPLVLVLAYRAGGVDVLDPPHSWDIGSEATVVALRGFDLAETADFLRSRGHSAVDDDLLGILVRLTGGHPLHLQQVITVGGAGPVSGSGPEGIRTAIARGIDRLEGLSRLHLSRAAVLGSTPVVAEAAAVAGTSTTAVEAALAEAVPAGLVTIDEHDRDRFSFGHELVREAFEALLSPAERERAHARAAAALAPTGPAGATGSGRLARHAHHALHAARRSTTDARTAVAACRAAARAMVAGFAYEQAVSLLAAASAAHEQAGLGDPMAALLVDWAEAVLMCGRLADARALFNRAVTAAAAEHDVVLLARATLGLGGVWVNEHRTQVEWERVVGLQRQALAGLPEDQVSLRHRLLVRLAVEDLYRGGPVEPVLAALDEARRLGDGKVLAEALSLCHHGLLTAAHTWDRLALAEELIAVAAPAGEGLLALIGLCWRTVDLFHLGDAGATRSLAELRERADALGCLSVLYIAEAMTVMLLIRAGRLDEAEDKAASCFALGTKVGDADAPGYLGAHLTTIRWFQGREAEIIATIEQLTDSPTLNPAEFGFQATAAHLAARAGHLDQARTALDRLTRQGLAALPDSSTWLAGMLAIVETAHLLGDADIAGQAYDLLHPFAELPIMPSLAVTCLGSVHRPLGLAALTFADLDLGIAHLEHAVAANRAFGNRPITAMTMTELADAHLQRQSTGDRERALHLLTLARDEAIAIRMTAYATAWTQRLDDLAEQAATIGRHGRQWILTLGDRRAVVPDRLGVRYLAHLLTNPGKPITARELAGGPGGPTLASTPPQPLLDKPAKADYRRRVQALTAAIDRADERGDSDRAQRLRSELEALFNELRRVTGRGGRTRLFADPGERARTAVRKAIKRAIDDIAAAEPSIGAILRATITTGATCCYTADDAHPVRWTSTTTP